MRFPSIFLRLGIPVVCLLLFIQGCCQPCEKDFLGEYPIQPDTQAWFEFTDISPRLFNSSQGGQRTFSYELPVVGSTEIQENCEETNCALCCDELRAETYVLRLVENNGGVAFQMAVEKDFSQSGGPSERPDILLLSLNGGLRCSAGNLPEGAILTPITLNGKTFQGVIACEVDPALASDNQDNIYAYYFQPETGIVGFIQADGTEWALQ